MQRHKLGLVGQNTGDLAYKSISSSGHIASRVCALIDADVLSWVYNYYSIEMFFIQCSWISTTLVATTFVKAHKYYVPKNGTTIVI